MTATSPRMEDDKGCESITREEWRANREAELRRSGEAWENGFRHLERYRKENGDCLVPMDYRDLASKFRLGVWVNRQRKDKHLSPECRQQLNALGFFWDALTATEERTAYRHVLLYRSRAAMVEWTNVVFADVPTTLFGSLSFKFGEAQSRIESEAKNDATIFLERILRRVPRQFYARTPKRIFVNEQNATGMWGLHFLMEPPAGMPLDQFITLCREQWLHIRQSHDDKLVDIQETRSNRFAGWYISKTWFATGGTCLLLENNYEGRIVKGHPLSLCVVS